MNYNKTKSFSANQSSFFVPAANYTHPDIFTKLVQHKTPFSNCSQCEWWFDKSNQIFKNEKNNNLRKGKYRNLSKTYRRSEFENDYFFDDFNDVPVFAESYVVDNFIPSKLYYNTGDGFLKSDDSYFSSAVEPFDFNNSYGIYDREIGLPVEKPIMYATVSDDFFVPANRNELMPAREIITNPINEIGLPVGRPYPDESNIFDDFFIPETRDNQPVKPVPVTPIMSNPINNPIPEIGNREPKPATPSSGATNPTNEIGLPVENPTIISGNTVVDEISDKNTNLSANIVAKKSGGYDWIPFIIASATILGFIYFSED
jgi:hypothetical protein